VELSPRTAPGPPETSGAPRRRSRWAYAVLVVVLVAVGVVAYQGLTEASLYFYEADEAYSARADLGDDRIRMLGAVDTEPEASDDPLVFDVVWDDQVVEVHHSGDLPELFQLGTAVVLEGRWDPTRSYFESDKILVKHDEQYEADNGDRIADAEDGQTGDASAP
jgi:cytochrome c-type biogenesis protein CcmE